MAIGMEAWGSSEPPVIECLVYFHQPRHTTHYSAVEWIEWRLPLHSTDSKPLLEKRPQSGVLFTAAALARSPLVPFPSADNGAAALIVFNFPGRRAERFPR